MGDGGGLAELAGEEMAGAKEMRWRVFVRAVRESRGVEGGEGMVEKRGMNEESEATEESKAGFSATRRSLTCCSLDGRRRRFA